jgi:CBS domain-containing protein
MLVSDVMTTTVVTATTETPFPELVDLMLRNGISGIPVVDGRHHPIGMVTETDLVSKEAYPGRRRLLDVAAAHGAPGETVWMEKARGLTAGALMSAPVHVIRPDDELPLAAAYMLAKRVNRLPVVDGGRLVGIVSRTDILRLFHRTDEDLEKDVERLLADPLVGPGDASITATVHNGVVTLAGDVYTPGHERIVGAVGRLIPGVVGVVVAEHEAVPTTS